MTDKESEARFAVLAVNRISKAIINELGQLPPALRVAAWCCIANLRDTLDDVIDDATQAAGEDKI